MTRSVVLGIGNSLLTDDGAGVHAARRIDAMLAGRDDVQVIDGGTLSFTLAPLIAGADRLIVIDAANLQSPPGTMRVFFDSDFDAFLGKPRLTVHEVSLVDLLDIARISDGLPRLRALIGIQPRTVDWGESLSPEVDATLGAVVATVTDLLETWPTESTTADSRACAPEHT